MIFDLWFFPRLFADILNDAAMFLEIAAPTLPFCFTVTVSTSNLAKVPASGALPHPNTCLSDAVCEPRWALYYPWHL